MKGEKLHFVIRHSLFDIGVYRLTSTFNLIRQIKTIAYKLITFLSCTISCFVVPR